MLLYRVLSMLSTQNGTKEFALNMKKIILISLIILTSLTGCAKKDEVVPDTSSADLYSDAQHLLSVGGWQQAIKKLEALDSRYPFGPYSQQTQLNLIYAYYKNNDFNLALASITRFVRINPGHKDLDWLIYMRGLNHMGQDHHFIHDLLNMDRSDRDPTPARSAFADFKQLLIRYPKSLFAADAQKRMIALKNRLANYDLATADFYLRKKAWIAAINRSQEIQKTYPDSLAARQSLHIQLKAYQQLKLNSLITKTEKLIELNPL